MEVAMTMTSHGCLRDQDRQVLGHLARLDGLDADLLERVGELHDVRRAVELPRYLRPCVQAKIDAIGLVDVGLPFWCSR
jgi:hypothetical protein